MTVARILKKTGHSITSGSSFYFEIEINLKLVSNAKRPPYGCQGPYKFPNRKKHALYNGFIKTTILIRHD